MPLTNGGGRIMKKDIRFLVTNSCNYGCYFCHAEGVSGTLGKNELTVENYITLFNLYSELEGWNGVTLSGGEPFLFRDIDELLKRLYEAGAQGTVVTNGALLDRHLPAIKYIKRINVSIHTTDPQMYGTIIGRDGEKLYAVENNLKTVRALYPELEIRLNVTPCLQNGWSIDEFRNLISYAKMVEATVKCTELFPYNQQDCVRIETLRQQVQELGYTYIPTDDRTECYENEGHRVFLTQCTCSKAVETDSPIECCRQTHDLYVNHDARFPLCRISNDAIDFWEEIETNDLEFLMLKMKLAQRKLSRESCNKQLRSIYF